MNSIKRTGLLFIFFSVSLIAGAQRINTGFNLDLYAFHFTRFPGDIVFSDYSYKGYYLKRLQAPGSLQNNYGANIIVDYSRFFINGRMNITAPIKGVIYKLSYPVGGSSFSDYYSRIQYQRFEFSATFGYFLKTSTFMRPFIEAGFGRSSPYYYREDFSDDKKFNSLWYGRAELQKQLALDKSYNFLVLGYGYRGDFFSIYAKYNIRVGKQDIFYSNLSLGFAGYTKFSKLRKHYIYQPEE
jgi:hypothetical protein